MNSGPNVTLPFPSTHCSYDAGALENKSLLTLLGQFFISVQNKALRGKRTAGAADRAQWPEPSMLLREREVAPRRIWPAQAG